MEMNARALNDVFDTFVKKKQRIEIINNKNAFISIHILTVFYAVTQIETSNLVILFKKKMKTHGKVYFLTYL